MKQNKYGTWAVGAFMLLLSAAACTDSYESTPVDMFTEDYLFSRTDSNGTVVRKYLNRIYYYMRNGHNGVNGDMSTTYREDVKVFDLKKVRKSSSCTSVSMRGGTFGRQAIGMNNVPFFF